MLGKKTLIQAVELRKQRVAALRGEEYAPEELEMARYPSSSIEEVEPAVTKELPCPKCPKVFNHHIALANHLKWHDESVLDKEFFRPSPQPSPVCCRGSSS